MTEEGFDKLLTEAWNNSHDELTEMYNWWGACRFLERKKILIGNKEALATFSVGPFKLAIKNDLDQYVKHFLEVILPYVIAKLWYAKSFIDVKEGGVLILISIFAFCMSNTVYVHKQADWGVLLILKEMQLTNEFVSIEELKSECIAKNILDLSEFEETIERLENLKNIYSTGHLPIVERIGVDKIKSLV
ncbi:MAG: hypothetical protein AB2651_19185 [Candidatus Thiodiazotropha sp.]